MPNFSDLKTFASKAVDTVGKLRGNLAGVLVDGVTEFAAFESKQFDHAGGTLNDTFGNNPLGEELISVGDALENNGESIQKNGLLSGIKENAKTLPGNVVNTVKAGMNVFKP